MFNIRMIFCIFILSLPISAAIAFDTSVDGGNNGGTTGSLSFNYTPGAAGNLVGVCLLGDNTIGNDDILTANYAGSAMTLVGKTTGGTATNRFVYYYMAQNVPAGLSSISITANSTHYLLAVAASWSGEATANQPDASMAFTPSSSSPYTTSLTTLGNNAWMTMCDGGFTITASTGCTQRIQGVAFQEPLICDSNALISPPASYSMTTTGGNVSTNDVHIMASICAISFGCTGAGTALHLLNLQGVGN
jgi:hypothetical protein